MSDNITPDDWESQLIDYTLGVMGPGEAAAFEADFAECRRNVQMARDYEVLSGWMGLATHTSSPPEGHKNRLMARIQSTPQAEAPRTAGAQALRPPLAALPPQQPAIPPTAPANVTDLGEYRARRNAGLMQALLGAAAVIIVLLGFWAWTTNDDKQTAQNQAAALQQNVAQLQAQATALAASPHIPTGYAVLPLPAQPGFESVNASVIYNKQTSDVQLAASGLAQPPAGKTYELWFLKPQNAAPDPAGTFNPDPAGNAVHPATGKQTVAQYAGFAVSVEPTGGSLAPTGPIIAAGTFSTP